MSRFVATSLVAVILLVSSPRGDAEPRVLTFGQALALARARAPAVRAAQLRIDEARGRRLGAAVLLRDNPVVSAAIGPRTSGATTVDVEVGVEQTFELGGRRAARVTAADAGIEQARAEADDATRRLLRDVAVAFCGALHAEEQVRLATAAETVMSDVLRVAERRRQLGDVAVLDVNVSRAALARARSDIRAAEAARSAALGELAALLGEEPGGELAVRGDLRERRPLALEVLLARSGERPDLRALAAEVRAAEADARLGAAQRWPDLGLGMHYAREEDANIFLGTVALTLPVFDHGQGLRADSLARVRRLRFEVDAGRRAVAIAVQTAFATYERRQSAALELEQHALPLLDENEALARRSYETGQLALSELLLIRRETFDTRTQYLDRLLDAAIAAIELESSAGALP